MRKCPCESKIEIDSKKNHVYRLGYRGERKRNTRDIWYKRVVTVVGLITTPTSHLRLEYLCAYDPRKPLPYLLPERLEAQCHSLYHDV